MRYFICFILAIATLVLAGCKNPPPQCDGSGESIRNLVTYHWLKGDHAEACRWLDRAVENRDYTACELLGWCYFMGDGVEQSNVQASRYFMRAAEIYWENWLLFIHYGDEYLGRCHRTQLYKNIAYFETMRDANVLKTLGLLNRSILLGNIAAIAKKDVVLQHLGDIISEEVQKKPIESRANLLDRVLGDFLMTDDATSGTPNELYSEEELMAGDWGRLPGLKLMILPEINPSLYTNKTDIITLAESIANMPSFQIGTQILPKPTSAQFEGIIKRQDYCRYRHWHNNTSDSTFNYCNDANESMGEQIPYKESDWGRINLEYSHADAAYIRRAYHRLADSDYRAGALFCIASALKLSKQNLSGEEWQDYFTEVIEKAKLSPDELSELRSSIRGSY